MCTTNVEDDWWLQAVAMRMLTMMGKREEMMKGGRRMKAWDMEKEMALEQVSDGDE